MSRSITCRKGTIKAGADESPDDVEVTFDRIKHVTGQAALYIVAEEEVWIPFSQTVDCFPSNRTVLITNWIADKKGLA